MAYHLQQSHHGWCALPGKLSISLQLYHDCFTPVDPTHESKPGALLLQVLEGVRGVQLLTPEQAQQFTAKEKDRKETVAVLDKAASVMHEVGLEALKQI